MDTRTKTRDLKVDMFFSVTTEGRTFTYEVWTDPVPASAEHTGRWTFMAKEITTGELRQHYAQPDWAWQTTTRPTI